MDNDAYKKIGKLLKEWRKTNGFSLYKIAKEGTRNARYDSLKRVEEGEGVSADTLLCYVDFCYQHGYRIFDEIYNKETLQQNIVVQNSSIENSPNEIREEEKTTQHGDQPIAEHQPEGTAQEEELPHDGEVLDEQTQVKFINRNICPHCASKGTLIQRNGTYGEYIECRICRHRAYGTLANPRLYKQDKTSGLRVQISNGVK